MRKSLLGAMYVCVCVLFFPTIANAATITFSFTGGATEPAAGTKTFTESGVQLDVTAQGAIDTSLGSVLVTKNSSGLGVNSSFDGVSDLGTFDSTPSTGATSVEERLVFTFTTSAPLVKLLGVDLLSSSGTPWGLNDNLDLYADGTQVLGPDFDPVVTATGVWDVTGAADVTFTSSFAIALTNNSLEEITRIQSITIETIPIPAAVWLFGSGLLGLVGVARRKARV